MKSNLAMSSPHFLQSVQCISFLLACNITLLRRDFASVCLSLGGNLQLHCIIIHWNWRPWKVPAKCCKADCLEERPRDTTRYNLETTCNYHTLQRRRPGMHRTEQ